MKTFVLFWNPAISSYTLDRLEHDIRTGTLNDDFNWSIRDYDKAEAGDMFFMVRCKKQPVPGKLTESGRQVWEPAIDDKCGICMAGSFLSDPYEGEDWSGRGRKTYYVDMYLDYAANPDKMPIIKTSDLMQAVPDFDWSGGASGRELDDESSDKVVEMLKEVVFRNREAILDNTDSAFMDWEFLRDVVTSYVLKKKDEMDDDDPRKHDDELYVNVDAGTYRDLLIERAHTITLSLVPETVPHLVKRDDNGNLLMADGSPATDNCYIPGPKFPYILNNELEYIVPVFKDNNLFFRIVDAMAFAEDVSEDGSRCQWTISYIVRSRQL